MNPWVDTLLLLAGVVLVIVGLLVIPTKPRVAVCCLVGVMVVIAVVLVSGSAIGV
jgi:hypothetical protein